MTSWPIQDAEARFGEVLDTCLKEGPQFIATEGEDEAVLMPIREWRRVQREARPPLKDLLLAPEPRADLVRPERSMRGQRFPAHATHPALWLEP